MVTVYMIGVNHNDPKGPEKLKRRLELLTPDIVLVEGSESGYLAQEYWNRVLRETLDDRDVDPELGAVLTDEQDLKQYEMRTARAYCESRGLPPPTFMNDYQNPATEPQIRFHIQTQVDHVRAHYTAEQARAELDALWEAVQELVQGFRSVMDTPEESEYTRLLVNHVRNVGEKDHVMEAALREAIAGGGIESAATITGFAHLINNPRRDSLYCRTTDLKPERHILFD